MNTLGTKRLQTPFTFKDDAPAGSIQAVFSTFNVVDRAGDVVVPGAILDGVELGMTWAHDWSKIIGKGITRTDATHAIFDGQLFLDSAVGAEAYATMRAMGDLMQYSWGFSITDAAPGTINGEPVRYIKGTELYEVSPVLIGEGRDTQTLSLKHGTRFYDQVDAVQAAVEDLIDRARSLADLRLKEGRVLSTSNRGRLSDIAGVLSSAATDLRAILKETEPSKQLDVATLFLDNLRAQARAQGVSVV
jgi:HK97 family phage prohead protease